MTRDEIIKMAVEAGISIRSHYDETGSTPAELQRFAELVAAATREECAALMEKQHAWISNVAASAAIRARGGKGQS